MGVNVFHRDILKLIPKSSFFGFDMLMKKMLEKEKRILPFVLYGEWLDIGRIDDYEKMIEMYQKNPKVFLP